MRGLLLVSPPRRRGTPERRRPADLFSLAHVSQGAASVDIRRVPIQSDSAGTPIEQDCHSLYNVQGRLIPGCSTR